MQLVFVLTPVQSEFRVIQTDTLATAAMTRVGFSTVHSSVS
jgi:hypothetical protein